MKYGAPLVVDASALAEYLVSNDKGRKVAALLKHRHLHIPHLAIVETASVLRGLVLGAHLNPERAAMALADLADFPATRWSAEPLLPRIWQLRSNLSAYDATYIALTEALDGELLTTDARLARGAESVSTIPTSVL